MCRLLGREDLLFGEVALPPFADRGVLGLAQFNERGGQSAPGAGAVGRCGRRVGEGPLGVGAEPLRGGEGPLDAARRPAVGAGATCRGRTRNLRSGMVVALTHLD